jgi:signal transduction histidine kinase
VIHPDDQAMVAENIQRRIVGEIETIHYEFRGRCKDGKIKHIEVLGGRTDLGGQPAIIGNLMDITDRKRAENEIARSLAAEKKARKVAEILREANESLSRTFDIDDVLHNLLRYLMHLVSYDSANVMLQEGDFQLRVVAMSGYEHWTDLDAAQRLVFDIRTIPSLNEVVTTQKSLMIANTYEYPGWLRVPGTEHVVSWLGVPIIANGQVIGLYSVDKAEPDFFTDEHRLLAEGLAAQAAVAIQNSRLHDQITHANVELEQRVASRTAQLEEANKELEAFAYSVSHDLRAPLRHIDGFIDMLQKRTGASIDDKSRYYMDVIADSAAKMGVLIDDLLLFSRMGRSEMFKSQVDLNELVQDVLRECRPETEGRTIQWNIATLPFINGDRAMLRVVLMNLMSNALKFTRSREVAKIEIGCEIKDARELIFFVRDNGVGFDMNYVDKLFGVFQRLHRQEDFEGTGIGLANVHRIINRHGGRTWAEGKLNEGATFYFSLPYIHVTG